MTADDPRPRTVKVPREFERLFARAEEIVSAYFARRADDPTRGTIEISGERYVLMRAASLSVEFFALVRELYGPDREEEADDFSRNLLFDLAHSVGRSDAQRFHAKMSLDDPISRLTAGPVHFSHTGWAFVDILPQSRPSPDEAFYLIYDHPYSFEAGAWREAGREAEFPVCIMNAGYSSGWCQESFGVRLVASELLCRARGDETCRFVMAHPDHIEQHLEEAIRSDPAFAGAARGYQIPDFFSRKRMEDELRRSRDDLERRVRERTAELEEANRRLQDEMTARQAAEGQLLQTARLEVVGRLAGSIAHDFNNLMSVVVGHASLLERRFEQDDPLLGALRSIRQAGEDASQLTQQLLAFSRNQIEQRTRIDVNELVRETVMMLERLIGEQITLDLQLQGGLDPVFADRAQLRQVLMNLVVNARDAMPDGGRLGIETRTVDGDGIPAETEGDEHPERWIFIAVSDEGVGMDPETQARAFEPFFTRKEPGTGTGLGLATVRRIVEQIGGRIAVCSSEGRGTTFGVYLPGAPGATTVRHVEEPAPSRIGAGATVLVVEDQPAVREMVCRVLEELGHRVLEAPDGPAALELAEEAGPIDLLLTDVVMPQMSGHELAGRLLERRRGMRVLLMSGYSEEELPDWASATGRASLIGKPFTADELAARIRHVLEEEP